MTTESVEPFSLEPDAFEVTFADPTDAELTWDRDDTHMPFALTPLASDYVRVIAAGMNVRYERFAGFPQRWRAAIWNGYAYFAIKMDPQDRPAIIGGWEAVCRAQIETVGRWWAEEARPELLDAYGRIASIDVEDLSGGELAEAWSEAWELTLRAWGIHFVVIMGPYQVIDDLADAFEKAIPDAPAGQALQLIQGFGDDLFDVEAGIERLAVLAARTPGVAASLGATARTEREDLLHVDGGPAFVEHLDAFLSAHGHLGQAFDDLALASWTEEPWLLLAEIAKRIDRPAVSATRRRERLVVEANALADRAREALADRPDELATFERLLAFGREVGPLTEGHNYWIDRMSQSRLRTLVMRIGRRLVADASLNEPDDVFFLYRSEIEDAVREPRDLRGLVRERRADHARWRQIQPPAVVGKPRTEDLPPDRFDGQRQASDDPDTVRGTGASPGVVRGAARVTLAPDDFGRIMPGDIIVCPSSNPSWVPVFAIAGGLVTNTGGVLSHAAVVAREFGLPAVVGTHDGTARIADGRIVEIDGTSGTVRLL